MNRTKVSYFQFPFSDFFATKPTVSSSSFITKVGNMSPEFKPVRILIYKMTYEDICSNLFHYRLTIIYFERGQKYTKSATANSSQKTMHKNGRIYYSVLSYCLIQLEIRIPWHCNRKRLLRIESNPPELGLFVVCPAAYTADEPSSSWTVALGRRTATRWRWGSALHTWRCSGGTDE